MSKHIETDIQFIKDLITNRVSVKLGSMNSGSARLVKLNELGKKYKKNYYIQRE